jgi:hypothetical protein
VGRGGESGFYYALGDSISNNKPDGVAHVFPTLLSQKLGIPLKMLAEPGSSAERVLTAQVPAIGRDCVLVTAVVANMEGYNAWLRRFVAVNGALLVDLDEDTRFKDPPFPSPYMYSWIHPNDVGMVLVTQDFEASISRGVRQVRPGFSD